MNKKVINSKKVSEVESQFIEIYLLDYITLYPGIMKILNEMASDQGMSFENFYKNVKIDRTNYNFSISHHQMADNTASSLDEEQVTTLAAGEETEMKKLREKLINERLGGKYLIELIDNITSQVF